jgi:hypothetical protein
MSSSTMNTSPMNVFCGQDKRLAEEEGNKILKVLILENVERYHSDNDKARKMKMTAELLEEFKIRSNGGSFYKYDKKSADWMICDDAKARDKISHALRFQYRTRRPYLQRSTSTPPTISPKRRKGRSESFDSCPGMIEASVAETSQSGDGSYLDETNHSFDNNSFDPISVFQDMILSGELDVLYSCRIYRNIPGTDDVDVLATSSFTEVTNIERQR